VVERPVGFFVGGQKRKTVVFLDRGKLIYEKPSFGFETDLSAVWSDCTVLLWEPGKEDKGLVRRLPRHPASRVIGCGHWNQGYIRG
jgi:hypothetical protein